MATTMTPVATWAMIAACCFAGGLALTFVTNPSSTVQLVDNLLFVAFHLSLLPVVMGLTAPGWGRASGYAWIAVDNAINVMQINGVANDIAWPMRLGIHIAAATWIICAATASKNSANRTIGTLAGVWLGGYSLIAPLVNNNMNLFYPATLLLLVWLLVVSFTDKATTGTTDAGTPTM